MKKTFVLDTCVFLSDPNCLKQFEENDIIIPLKVLDEIDKNKARQDGAGFNARYVIRILDVYRTKGSLFKGVSLGEGKGKLFVQHYETEGLPHDFDLSVPDNQIIATALTEKAKYKRKKVIVVSQDINMRVKCDSLGLLCEDYVAHDTVENKDEVFTGLSKYLVDEQVVDSFYAGEDIFADKEEITIALIAIDILLEVQNQTHHDFDAAAHLETQRRNTDQSDFHHLEQTRKNAH